MLELSFSSKLDLGSYIVSIAKTASNKMGAVICSKEVSFSCCEIALNPLWPYKPYDLAWNTFVMPGLVLLIATWNY